MPKRPPNRTTDHAAADSGPDSTADSGPADSAPGSGAADSGRTGGPARARGKVTDDERERMRQLARDGLSVRAIAKDTSRSADAVSRAVRDIGNERREQTAAANQARSVDFAEQRTKLMDQTLRVARVTLAHVVSRAPDDSRGRVDEARAYSALVGAYARLDERHASAQTGDGSDIDAYLDRMAPAGDGSEQ